MANEDLLPFAPTKRFGWGEPKRVWREATPFKTVSDQLATVNVRSSAGRRPEFTGAELKNFDSLVQFFDVDDLAVPKDMIKTALVLEIDQFDFAGRRPVPRPSRLP